MEASAAAVRASVERDYMADYREEHFLTGHERLVSAMEKEMKITLTIRLGNGAEHSFRVQRMPRNWKSWLMQQVPYGTDLRGCTFRID